MTAGLRADAGGAGAIQVGGVDRLTLNPDGSLVASANPATGSRSMELATMQKFADEFGGSLATSGYQRLPSGLIIQWGQASYTTITGAARSTSHVFPVAFPNALLSASATIFGAGSNDCVSITASSLTGITIESQDGSNNVLQAGTHRYIAIGY